MRKIGYVIAYSKGHTNYGTSLQGYALLKKMQELGHDVEIVHYIKQLSLLQKVKFVVNAVRCGETKGLISRFTERKMVEKNPNYALNLSKRVNAVEAYKAKKIIPFFCDYFGFESLSEGSKKYDAVVVGSDQVWTPLSLPNKFFNLLFVDDSVRKVAYASSFGVSEIPKFQKKATGWYLDRFYKVGVREQKGKEIVDSLSHKNAQVVADPTLLLNRDEWEKEIENIKPCSDEPYIFCYFLGKNQDARRSAKQLKEATGYKLIVIRHMDEYIPEDENFGDEAPYDVDPNDFVKYISQAAYVCTDSFHCTVFSIIFHKKFMTFYRFAVSSKIGRNSRIDSLFNVLGIEREHIYDGGDIVRKIEKSIDWNKVDKELENLTKESISFLSIALA